MRHFVKKSFKLCVALSSGPLAFVAVFGALTVKAWTSRGDLGYSLPRSAWTRGPACFKEFPRAVDSVHRAAEHALHDNLRRGFRLGVLLILAVVGSFIGFHGVMIGLALAEGIGVVYMFFALAASLRWFAFKIWCATRRASLPPSRW